MLSLVIYGDQDEKVLRELAESARDDLLKDEKITQVELGGVRPLEISVEVPQARLRAYGLTIEQIASVIGRSAIELPGGGVKTAGGEILLRTAERRDWGREFENITILSTKDGTRVRLGDIARIRDWFEDQDVASFFNGKPAVMPEVYRIGDQTPLEVADAVKKYKERLDKVLPPWRENCDMAGSLGHLSPACGPAQAKRLYRIVPGAGHSGAVSGSAPGFLGHHGNSHFFSGLISLSSRCKCVHQHDLFVRLYHHPGNGGG